MTWKKNPRTLTKEQFSTGTTIDGDRIDNALDDVVERVNDIPYGDLRKRWVPTTYAAGWSPQSPACISSASPSPTTGSSASSAGGVYGTHHWPWLRVLNNEDEVADDTSGSASTDDTKVTNPYRLKGAGVPGINPFGQAAVTATSWTPSTLPDGIQLSWTRSWFVENPSILDAIDLILEVDDASLPAGEEVFSNTFAFTGMNQVPDGYPDVSSRDLVITASVDSEFAREDRNMADVEVLRKGFVIGHDSFSTLALPTTAGSDYQDMSPSVNNATDKTPSCTIKGPYISLRDLNIPIHQNARLRVSVVIPSYVAFDITGSVARNSGWNPINFSSKYSWMQQKIHMAVTMLEEVTHG
tara:strand:+ start:573 stop:1637 length:1065 start_codon:yes stop_codon:yes gene_type:complete